MSEDLNTNSTYYAIRNSIGILGCLLPVLSILGALFSPNVIYSNYWWTSISVTYYSTPVLISILSSVGIFLIVYSFNAYSKWDRIVNLIAGVAAIGVVIFPCVCPWLEEGTKVGLFYLPMKVSNYFHCASAFLVFLMLALNNLCLFSKSNNSKKNLAYRICGITILVALVLFALNGAFFNIRALVITLETIMLLAFGISWIIKGHLLDNIFSD